MRVRANALPPNGVQEKGLGVISMPTIDERKKIAENLKSFANGKTGVPDGIVDNILGLKHESRGSDIFTSESVLRLAGIMEDERTCRIVHRNDFQKALGEHSIWYECGFGIMIADGTQEPVYCPGCGALVVE